MIFVSTGKFLVLNKIRGTKLQTDSRLSFWRSIPVVLGTVCGGFMVGCGGNGPTISPPPPPAQFVLAYTRPTSGPVAQIDTRLSIDGAAWSLPVAVSDGGPVPVKVGVPPGLATDGRAYQVAWFDPMGVLNTRVSSDGSNWNTGTTHGIARPTDRQSRPTVAVGNGHWIAAIRLANNELIIQPLDGSASIVLMNGATTPPTPLISTKAPALAYGNGTFVLAFLDAAMVLRTLVSTDGETWPLGPGTALPFPAGVAPPAPPGSAGLLAGMTGAPYLTFGTDGLFHLAATRVARATSASTIFDGQILTHNSPDGTTWALASVIDHSTAVPVGLAIAGPATGQVIVEPAPRDGTVPAVYVNASAIDPSPLTRSQILVSSPVSLVHGPRRIDIRNFSIVFERFKRIPDPGSRAQGQTEDVTLEVRHADFSGAVVSTLNPWTVDNALLRQQNFWNYGRATADLPKFLGLTVPGDTLTVSVTGEDGTVNTTLTHADIVAGTACPSTVMDVDMPLQSFSYQVWRTCSVAPQSVP